MAKKSPPATRRRPQPTRAPRRRAAVPVPVISKAVDRPADEILRRLSDEVLKRDVKKASAELTALLSQARWNATREACRPKPGARWSASHVRLANAYIVHSSWWRDLRRKARDHEIDVAIIEEICAARNTQVKQRKALTVRNLAARVLVRLKRRMQKNERVARNEPLLKAGEIEYDDEAEGLGIPDAHERRIGRDDLALKHARERGAEFIEDLNERLRRYDPGLANGLLLLAHAGGEAERWTFVDLAEVTRIPLRTVELRIQRVRKLYRDSNRSANG